MGVAKRVLQTLTARTGKAEQPEEDPQVTLDSSYRRQLELLIQVRRGVADVAEARERVESQMNALRKEQVEMEGQAGQVSGAERDQRGHETLRRRAAIESELSGLALRHNSLQADEERLTAACGRLAVKVEAFRVQKEAIQATYAVAEAQRKIGEVLSTMSKRMGNDGMAAISSQRQLEALAQVGGGVEEVAASRERLELLMNTLREQQEKLDGKARQALNTGQEDLAQETLAQKAAIESQLSDLSAQLVSIQTDEEKVKAVYDRLAAKVEAFRE